MTAEQVLGHTSMPLWQFVGLLVIFSILIGSPIFVCFVYHRRKERDRINDELRRMKAHATRPGYSIDGRDYYMVPFPSRDIKRAPSSRVGTPRREVSGGSTVPLLVINTPAGSRVSSRNVSPLQGRIGSFSSSSASAAVVIAGPSSVSQEQREAVLNVNFAERTGTASSLAYPKTVHRGTPHPGTTGAGGRNAAGNYGTLGHVMHSTYTAAQRAYRGRHRLNFWSGWMLPPWGGRNQQRLEAIDEESVGSSRFSRGGNRGMRHGADGVGDGATATTATSSSSNVDITRVTRGGVVAAGSVGTLETETSGYSMRGTPPTFEKVDSREPYNPSMARSLTRRLLKFGFDQLRDGVTTPEKEDQDDEDGKSGGRQASGVWKKGFELKKRALERKKLETGNRLFSFQKKKGQDDGEEEEEGEETDIDPEDLAKTSIRDFAHAFNQDIVGGEDGVVSATGTIRIHRIDDEEDQSIILSEDTTTTSTSSSPDTATFDDIDLDQPSSPNPITNENVPTNTASTTQIEISTPAGTLRGRKSLRDRSSVPGTQKMRMTRNTPKNTLGRAALQISMEEIERETEGVVSGEVEGAEVMHVGDITKEA
ncbi:hypothetical protein TWF281_006267 [Arthrobotrys megalospora]